MEEEIVTQLGLLLTQLRFTRRAVEDIERSTARYGGFTFATALAAGPRFGEPPMVSGALKVYVVNINDLAPGSGIGGFLEGLLGGIGRFFGGFLGGIVGGTISGVTIPFIIGQLNRLAERIEHILAVLGIGTGTAATPAATSPATPTPTPGEGMNLLATLAQVERVVTTFTALFQAASTGPDAAARTSPMPSTPGGERWLAMLTAASAILTGISHVVDGLVLLVPLVIGALAFVITRLDDVKLAFMDMLQFILRNVLLLRGVVLTTLFDTVSAAARLAANVLGILATAVGRILGSIFTMVGALLDVAVTAIRFIANGLQRTIDALLRWLVESAFVVLTKLGDSLVFRFIVHVVQLLPSIIPPLWELKFGKPFTGPAITAPPIAPPSLPGGPGAPLPAFPDLATIIAPAATVFSDSVRTAAGTITSEMTDILGSASGALSGLSGSLDAAAAREARAADRLGDHYRTVRDRSRDFAAALTPAVEASRREPATGFEAIARAYESWLGTGGLDTLLGTITEHFRHGPTSGTAATSSLPGAVTAGAVGDRPRATIEIDAITIQIAPPATGAAPTTGATSSVTSVSIETPELSVASLTELFHELEERGWNPALGPLVTQVT
ncbi:hypothetical protein NR800_18095 [Corallococcus interemptor]|uniref:hypothetical protein n=1 Tax=Corallococcus interemptor TaxID=2316720 RepID=UPI0035D48B7A